MKKIIYILGLSYSGSTILDLLLGLHPRIFGFGELNLVYKEQIDFKKRYCSCGKKISKCSFWKGFKIDYQKEGHEDFYNKFVKYFYNKKDSTDIILDSSKKLSNLKKVKKYFPKTEIKVIFLIRDVRGFSLSMYRHRGKTKLMIPFYQAGWLYKNKKYKKFLQKNSFDYLLVSYESLCLNKNNTLKKICNFLNIDFSEKLLKTPQKSSSHIISGNSVRNDNKRKKAIKYDSRWFQEGFVNFCYSINPILVHWNNKNIY